MALEGGGGGEGESGRGRGGYLPRGDPIGVLALWVSSLDEPNCTISGANKNKHPKHKSRG